MITITTKVNAPMSRVWEYWTKSEHIVNWNAASDDWHTTKAENDVRVGGSFIARMEAKDGSAGFDFGGTYDEVVENEKLAYTMGDTGRKVVVAFEDRIDGVTITESFDPESQNSEDMQRAGWQAILDNFKQYVESK